MTTVKVSSMCVARVSVVVVAVMALAGCVTPASKRRLLYPNGQVRWEVETRSGLPHGSSTTWHENGKVSSRGSYLNGQKHGVFVYYDENGEKEREAYYENGREIDGARAKELGFEAPRPEPAAPAVAPQDGGAPATPPEAATAPDAPGRADATPAPPASYIRPVQTGIGVFSPGLGISGLHIVRWADRLGIAASVAFSRESRDDGSLTSVAVSGSLLGTLLQSGNARLALGGCVGVRRLTRSFENVESSSATLLQLAAPLRAEVLLARNFAVHAETALVFTFASDSPSQGEQSEGITVELNTGDSILGSVGFTIYF